MIDERFVRVSLRFDPPPGGWERLVRRRDRKRRNQRLSAAAMAVIVAVAAGGLLARSFRPSVLPLDDSKHAPSAGGTIVFNEFLGQHGQDFVASFTVNPDGSGLTQVGPDGTTYCGDNDDPWSPDGGRIVCQVFRPDLTTATATMDADGSNYSVLSSAKLPGSFGCGAWSPDGTRLLCPFTSDGIYTVEPDGRGLLRLTTRSSGAGPSGYALDGSRAYFTAQDQRGELQTLYSVATDGSGGIAALSPPNVSVHDVGSFDGVSADSSPDGSELVFAADLTRTQSALYLVNIDGSGLHGIETPTVNPTSAQWSPDGKWIVFSAGPSTADGYSEVYLVHPDGSELRQVTSSTEDCASLAPIWSPDGSKVLFETECYSGISVTSTRLQTANLDGSGLANVANLNGLTSYGWGSEGAG